MKFMKQAIISIIFIFFSYQALANDSCFIAKENNNIIEQKGECSKVYPLQSTFKITLSLIGFDSGILVIPLYFIKHLYYPII